MIELTKMTRDTLRELPVGQTRLYRLPTAKQCESARVMCTYLKAYEGMEFKTAIDVAGRTIAITRFR